MNDWVKLIIEICAVLTTVIPLVYKLIEYVQKATKEKNWSQLIELVYKYVVIAEEKFTSGADKKEWVIAMIKGSADAINYDFDEADLSKLIDNIISVTKNVNVDNENTADEVIADAIEEALDYRYDD